MEISEKWLPVGSGNERQDGMEEWTSATLSLKWTGVLAVLSVGSTEHWQYYFSLDTIYKCIT